MLNIKYKLRLFAALLLTTVILLPNTHDIAFAQESKHATTAVATPTSVDSKGSPATPGTKELPLQSDADSVAPLPWPRYGIDMVDMIRPATVASASAAGAEAARVFVYWSEIEPTNTTPNNYRWSRYDTVLSSVAAGGLDIHLLIARCPTWACQHENGPITLALLAEFREFISAFARRYSVAPYNAHYWEFWDEPDGVRGTAGNLGWGRHGAEYANALAAVVPSIRAIDPKATIANGGVAYDWFTEDTPTGPFYRNFLPEFLQAGGGAYIDYLVFHYEPANIHWPNIIAKVTELRELLRNNNFNKPLVSGEAALTSSSDPAWGTPQWGPNTQQTQARFIVQNFAQSAAAGLPGIFWFTIMDYPPSAFPGAFEESGLTRIDGSRKPSFYAYQTLVQEVGAGAYVRVAAAGEFGPSQLEAHLFDADRGPVWLMWANSASLVTAALPQAEVLRVLNMAGEEQQLQADGSGNIKLELSQDPYFVELRPAPRFSDVPYDFFAFNSIEYLAARGIVSGYSAGLFQPQNLTTRGQLAKIITLAQGWSITTAGDAHLSDISRDNPFYDYINTAYMHGVISGYEDGTFRWNESITRAQLAKIIVRARGWAINTTDGPHFRDVAADNPFYDYIETAYNHHIVSGYDTTDGLEFRWSSTATRAQIAKVVHLAIAE